MKNKKSERQHRMYQSIISGLQEIIDDVTEQSKHNKTESDGLIHEVPLSTEDSHVDIIPDDTGSDNNNTG